jgi:TP901 family phage tail tape measure protein
LAKRTEKIEVQVGLRDELTGGLRGISRKMKGFGVGAAKSIGPIIAALGAAKAAMVAFDLAVSKVRGAIAFEEGLIGVGKTSGLTGDQLQKLGAAIRDVSLRVPVATGELLSIGQAAGQLGVTGSANIARFVETVAKLGGASDLVGDEAATTLARLLQVTREPTANVDRLASALVALGNTTAATEREIASTAQSVAQAASTFDLSSADAAGFGATLAAVGVRAELAGSSVGRLLRSIDAAVRDGGDDLDELARIAGTTSEAFADLFVSDRVGASTSFLAGLDRLKKTGGDVTATLTRLGLSGEENLRVVPVLAGNIDLLNKSLETSRTGFRENVALNEEAAAAADGLGKKIRLLLNAIEAATAVGQGTLDKLKLVVDFTRDVVVSLAGLDRGMTSTSDNARAYAGYLRTVGRAIRDLGRSIANALRSLPGLDLLQQAVSGYAGLVASTLRGDLIAVQGFSARAGDFLRATFEVLAEAVQAFARRIATIVHAMYESVVATFNATGRGAVAAFNAVSGPLAVAIELLIGRILDVIKTFAGSTVGIVVGVSRAIGSVIDTLKSTLGLLADIAVLAGKVAKSIASGDLVNAANLAGTLKSKLGELSATTFTSGAEAAIAFGRGFDDGMKKTAAAVDVAPALIEAVTASFRPVQTAKLVLGELEQALDAIVINIASRAEGFRLEREEQDALDERIAATLTRAKDRAVKGINDLAAATKAAVAESGVARLFGFGVTVDGGNANDAEKERTRVLEEQEEALDKVAEAETRRAATVAELNDLVEIGTLTEEQGRAATAAAFDVYRDAVNQARDALLELAKTTEDPRLQAELLSAAANIEGQLQGGPAQAENRVGRFGNRPLDTERFSEDITSIGTSSRTLLADGVADALGDIATKAKSASEAFKDMAREFALAVAKMITQKLALAAIDALIGALSGGIGGGGGITAAVARNTGGVIPGRGPDVDSVPAVLTPGEYVTRRRAVDAVGVPVMAAINNVRSRLEARDLFGTLAERLNAGGLAGLRTVANAQQILAAHYAPTPLPAGLNRGGLVEQFASTMGNAVNPFRPSTVQAPNPADNLRRVATPQAVVVDANEVASRTDVGRTYSELLARQRDTRR